MPIWIRVVLVVLAIAVGLFAVDRLFVWMESRGWIYWRHRPVGSASPARGILTEFQQLVEPQIRHVIEDQQQRRAVNDERQGQEDE
jgi:hypothetical protein